VANGIGAVPLGETDPDDRTVCTFAQWLALYGREPRLHRLGEATCEDQALAKALECVGAQFAKTLALDQEPVVVPTFAHWS
jgi:hypothetical protein